MFLWYIEYEYIYTCICFFFCMSNMECCFRLPWLSFPYPVHNIWDVGVQIMLAVTFYGGWVLVSFRDSLLFESMLQSVSTCLFHDSSILYLCAWRRVTVYQIHTFASWNCLLLSSMYLDRREQDSSDHLIKISLCVGVRCYLVMSLIKEILCQWEKLLKDIRRYVQYEVYAIVYM